MKKLLLIVTIAIFLCSCTKNENGVKPKEVSKSYIVDLGLSIQTSDIPMADKASKVAMTTEDVSSDDIYMIQVSSIANDATDAEWKSYSYGLFDNKSNMKIKMLDGFKYKIQASLIKDGKKKLFLYEGGYYYPLYVSQDGSNTTKITNEFIYSSSVINGISAGNSTLAVPGKQDGLWCDHPNYIRYYGELLDYVPSENGSATVDMIKTVFGIKYIPVGLTEGKLIIKLDKAPEVTIESGTSEFLEMYTFMSLKDAWDNKDNSDWFEPIVLAISWQKLDGTIIPLYSGSLNFKRNTIKEITINIKEPNNENGLGITEENPTISTETITIGGDSTDNDVNP